MVDHFLQQNQCDICSHLAGLEPATFRLTAERANQLRHKCWLTTYGLSIILGQYLGHRAKLT